MPFPSPADRQAFPFETAYRVSTEQPHADSKDIPAALFTEPPA